MVIMAIDPQRVQGFEQDILELSGLRFDLSTLEPGQAVANASAAEKLNLQPGSLVDIWVGSVPRTVTIVGIVQDSYVTGWTLEDPEGILVSLNTELSHRIAEGAMGLETPGLADHLWATTLAKLAVAQPTYAAYRASLAERAPKA